MELGDQKEQENLQAGAPVPLGLSGAQLKKFAQTDTFKNSFNQANIFNFSIFLH
jgi:hypothetical protein